MHFEALSRALWLVAAASSLSLPPLLAQSDGRAPAGAWVTQGGGPGRARCTATAPLRRAPELAWSYRPAGKLAGEPVAWGDSIVVEEERGAQRALMLLDRASGRRIGPEILYRSPAALAPALWGDKLIVRGEPQRLHGLRIGPRGLSTFWHWRADGELGEPLLVDGICFVVAKGSAIAIRMGARTPLWSDAGGFLGPIALAPDGLEVLAHEPVTEGWTSILLDPRSGERKTECFLWERPGALGNPLRASLVAGAGGVLLRPERPFQLTSGTSASLFASVSSSVYAMLDPTGVGHLSPAAAWSGGWLARRSFDGEEHWLLSAGEHGAFRVLASKVVHPRLLGSSAAPAIATDVAYMAGMAVDLGTLDVLWRSEMQGPMIPVAGGLLHLAPDGALEAWLGHAPATDMTFAPGYFPAVASGWSAEDASAVLSDGTLVRGRLELAASEGAGADGALALRRTRGKRVEEWPLAEVALLRDAAGQPVWTRGRRGLVEGVSVEAEELAGEAALELARRAQRSKDPVALARALEAVERWRSTDEKLLESLQKELERGEGSRRRADPAADAELLTALAELQSLAVDRLWATFEELPEAVRGAAAFDVLRRVLQLAPQHAGAQSWIAARAPVEEIRSPREASEWLEFLEIAERVELAVHHPPDGPRTGLSHEQRRLGQAQGRWRKDLLGIRSPRLLVITSVARPGVLARVIANGELLCTALEKLFDFGEHERDTYFPLEIRLYDSQEEYLAQSAQAHPHADLSWTAGHFSEEERLSRLFVPDGERGFEQARQTFLHELTHHWLAERCPAFSLEQRIDARRDLPGYWIAEGFACIAEGLELDVERGTWRFGATVGQRLDLAAHIPEGDRLSWRRLFRTNHTQLPGLVGRGEVRVPFSRRLGVMVPMDRVGLFYAQSAAAARYLFEAEDGAHRRALLLYLIAWYRGDRTGVDVDKAFGLSFDELGARIIAWARSRVEDPG